MTDATRDRLVDSLLDLGVIRDPRVAEAMRAVPREAFLDASERGQAYEDRPVSIGMGQTMSAPHMVALMCDRLELSPGLRVLEVGTGSGYHAAVAARLVAPGGSIVSIEFFAPLADQARENLRRAGVANVRVVHGDGARGLPKEAPFDRIYLACAAPVVPPPLLAQVAPDGMLIAPVGRESTRLVRMRRSGDGWNEDDLGGVAFVPLRGAFGDV